MPFTDRFKTSFSIAIGCNCRLVTDIEGVHRYGRLATRGESAHKPMALMVLCVVVEQVFTNPILCALFAGLGKFRAVFHT